MIYKVFGYKVFKENDVPFGYDKTDGNLVVNSVESAIVKYTFETELKPEKKTELPADWIKYLDQKNEECEKIENSVEMETIEMPEWVRVCGHTLIIDEDTFKAVQAKFREPQEEDSGMQMNM